MKCVTFFVDELLWMLTWGWYQLALALVFSWFIFIVMGRMRLFPAFFLTIGSYAFAMSTYFIVTSCFLINFFEWKLIGEGVQNVYNPLDASLLLGGILSVLQGLFYCVINYFRSFYIIHFFVLSLISNLLAALCASFFIKLSF